MSITFDPKREATLLERKVDFADAGIAFEGLAYTFEDSRQAYPEPRYVTAGLLARRMVIVVWTGKSTARNAVG